MVPWRSAELSGRSFLFVKSRRQGHLLQAHRSEGRGGRTGTGGHVNRRQGHPPERQRNAAWWGVRLPHRQRHGPLGAGAGGREDGHHTDERSLPGGGRRRTCNLRERGSPPHAPDGDRRGEGTRRRGQPRGIGDRKSTRLNSSHANISYAVFCLKKKKHTIKT